MIRLVKKFIEEEKILWRTSPREVFYTWTLLFFIIVLLWVFV